MLMLVVKIEKKIVIYDMLELFICETCKDKYIGSMHDKVL